MIIMAKDKNINIAVATLTSTNRPQLDGFITRSKLVQAINLEIAQLCIKHDAQFIDYYTVMTETKEDIDYLRNELTDDGLHPHVLGYDRMADTLVNTLPYPIQLKN